MTRPVIENRNKYNNYGNNYSHTQNPINSVIDGYFPQHKTYKEMAIARVHRSLCGLFLLFILTSAISYYFVTASEITLNKYRKQVVALNDENVDLQNKLDYLKSYYNVDKAMQKQHFLQKAKTVMEVKDSYTVAPLAKDVVAKSSDNTVQSYQWALGF